MDLDPIHIAGVSIPSHLAKENLTVKKTLPPDRATSIVAMKKKEACCNHLGAEVLHLRE